MKTQRILCLLLFVYSAPTCIASGDDVVKTAQKEGYSAFHDAVMQAGLYEHAKKDIDEKGSLAPFTVFVPTNQAFEALVKSSPEEQKKSITFHVVPRKKIENIATEMETGVTTVGEQLLFAKENKIFLDESDTKASIIKGPIQARNGLVYIIDTVLLPAGQKATKQTPSVQPHETVEKQVPTAEPVKVAPQSTGTLLTEQTGQALTNGITQLTQSMQQLTHAVQEAQRQASEKTTASNEQQPIIVS